MIKNYFKVAIRNILKHKLFSIINLSGLVAGITCCMLIFVYVQDELTYDTFHKDHQSIYRVALHGKIAGQEVFTSNTAFPLAHAMKSEIPGVEEVLRIVPANGQRMPIRYEDKSFIEEGVYFADSNFFHLFSFELLRGDRTTALSEPNSVVITADVAKKYFGEEDPIGKTLLMEQDKKPLKVTGVAANVPSASHIHFRVLVSFSTVEKTYYQGWTANYMFTYFRKSPLTPTTDIDIKLGDIVAKYVGKELEAGLGINFEEFRKQGGIYAYFIFPIADSHLRSGLGDDIEATGNIQYVFIFAGIGIFILLIACVNFMNLATAQSSGRAKEVGLRKTLGSARRQMIFQFLSESFIYSFLAVVIAAGISFAALPYFNLLSGKSLTLEALKSPVFLGAAGFLVIAVGLVAGSYPALYLTSFKAVEVLKGKLRSGMRTKGVRSSLVVFQFAVSTFLIIATVVVFQQLDFMQTQDLGFDTKNVIMIRGADRLGNNMEAFRNAVNAQSGIEGSSFTNNVFPGVNNTTIIREKGKSTDHIVGLYAADWEHLQVMKISLKEGRYFSREFGSDTLAAVINEAAVHEYGFQHPIGQELEDNNDGKRILKIIGVVKDFNFESLKLKVRPMILKLTNKASVLLIRYHGDPSQAVRGVEEAYTKMAPGEPFEYSFLDERFDSLFRAEKSLRDVFTVFSALAIFIACMGLFALAAFTTEQRTKEIGVRKAMGATSWSLTLLLSKEFTRLVVIAIIPAVTGGWFLADWWLKEFPYRVTLNPLLFAASAAAAIAIAWLTVSYQSVKAASTNPVTSLRYE